MSCDEETEIEMRTHVIVSKYRGSPTAIAYELARAEIKLQAKVVQCLSENKLKNNALMDVLRLTEQLKNSLKRSNDLVDFLKKIMMLGLLRGSARLRDEALALLDGENAVEGEKTDGKSDCPREANGGCRAANAAARNDKEAM